MTKSIVHGNIRPSYLMVYPSTLFPGSHFNVLRVKLLDNLVEMSSGFVTVQRYNFSNKLPIYIPKDVFTELSVHRPSNTVVSQLDVSSTQAFALGLIALELGLMTPLADKVCNTKTGVFDVNFLEDSFTNFRNKYSNYPQLIQIIHELVGARTAPRTDPDYLLTYQQIKPADLVCYDALEAPVSRGENSIGSFAISAITVNTDQSGSQPRVYETPVKYMNNHYTSNNVEPLPQTPPRQALYVPSPEASPSSDEKNSRILLVELNQQNLAKVAEKPVPTRQIDRSRSPIAQNQRPASPYRPLLSDTKSRPTTPTKRPTTAFDVYTEANSTNSKQRKKYVSKVDIGSSQMALRG